MKNIFKNKNNLELQERLQKRSSEAQRQWGKMNVSQMLAHCQKPLEVAEQKLVIKRNLMSLLFGRMMKSKLINKGENFKTNLATTKAFIANSTFDFETEKAALSRKIIEFGRQSMAIIQVKTHPFFSDITPEEWGIIFCKHLHHHSNSLALEVWKSKLLI